MGTTFELYDIAVWRVPTKPTTPANQVGLLFTKTSDTKTSAEMGAKGYEYLGDLQEILFQLGRLLDENNVALSVQFKKQQ